MFIVLLSQCCCFHLSLVKIFLKPVLFLSLFVFKTYLETYKIINQTGLKNAKPKINMNHNSKIDLTTGLVITLKCPANLKV